ncbi:MAG: hypothetical protein J6Q56_02730, partial [Clostridia bacterium]|nr:hypothetical protein [Clostridia bacterium]
MKKLNLRKHLALVMSAIMLLVSLPMAAFAATDSTTYLPMLNGIASSMDLGITVGEEIAGYDFNELSSVPSGFTNSAQGIQSITVNSETKNAFNVKSDSSATTVTHAIGKNNFAAVMTFTVNPN